MSDHWYARDGLPCYEQPTLKGGLRATDLRDARKMGLVPSVTTVLNVVAKPQLEQWKVRQGILAALTLPLIDGESEADYLLRIDRDGRQQAKDAAEEGTRIHDAIEQSFKGGWVAPTYRPHVEATRALIADQFPQVTDWIPERSFADPCGFGGKVDLHSPSTGIVIDYKGKDGDFSDGKKLAYDQHWQLAAYQAGLCLPRSVCANVFVSRTHPGKVASHIWTIEEITEGLAVFKSALGLWKAMKRFDPAFNREQAAA